MCTHDSYYEKIGSKVNCISEEIPFEIPDNWQYIRLKDYFELLSGRDLQKQDYNDKKKGIPYITGASNFINNKVLIERWTEKPQVITKIGDLLITCKGTVGKISYNMFGDAHIARQVMAIRNTFEFNIDFLELCMLYYVEKIKKSAKGMIPGIARYDLLNILLPIPPIKYQKELVYTLKEYRKIIESIEKSLF